MWAAWTGSYFCRPWAHAFQCAPDPGPGWAPRTCIWVAGLWAEQSLLGTVVTWGGPGEVRVRVLGSALEMVWVGLSRPGVSTVSSLQVAHLGRLWAGPSRFGDCWEGGGSGLWRGASWVLRVSWSNNRLAEPRLCAWNIVGRAPSPPGAVGPPMVAPGLQLQEDSWEGGQSPGVRVAGLRAGGGARLAAHFTATWPWLAGPGGCPAASQR